MSLAGQVAVITGGAGGIGWASAQEWLACGGQVVIADLPSQAEKAAELVAAHAGAAVFVAVRAAPFQVPCLLACALPKLVPSLLGVPALVAAVACCAHKCV